MVNLETIEPSPNPNSSWRNKVAELASRVRGGASKAVLEEEVQTEWSKDVSIVGLVCIGGSADMGRSQQTI
jgi:hypothetical protein